MIPYKTIIQLDRKNKQPLYIQISNQIIALIKDHTLPPCSSLPSSRKLAELLNVHRKTIIACYDELNMQGWIETVPKKGTFVNAELPLFNSTQAPEKIRTKEKASFSFNKNPIFDIVPSSDSIQLTHLNEGVSDERLAPVEDLVKIYRSLIKKKTTLPYLSYHSTHGNPELRETLAQYLNETRGLTISKDNVLITRGSQMGIYLATQLLLNQDEYIIVGESNYLTADITFQHSGAKILRVPIDQNGLNTKEIERLCKIYSIKAVYATPHHHHPTTVILSAKRRIHLLNLAQTYRFAIIEDDYNYDFNYNHAPILPLATHDQNSNVIYIGSVCKTVAPVFRVGYLIAAKEFVDECAQLRRYIDRQGDSILELTFAHFIKNGDLDRHIRKILKIYKVRRDLFCSLLKKELNDYFEFDIPHGGMAVWVKLNNKYTWDKVAKIASQNNLSIENAQQYDIINKGHNGIRMGFASYTEEEIHEIIQKLKTTMNALKK
ncbi:putative HTH-type transcriptional regulator YhdI [Flavobacteriaceae bacterium UJ101]|nr:putative HTH-type transcriptional regulator YhdI [Flavobacteriaceae bacterium UJ101]